MNLTLSFKMVRKFSCRDCGEEVCDAPESQCPECKLADDKQKLREVNAKLPDDGVD
jgi:rubrerythrin